MFQIVKRSFFFVLCSFWLMTVFVQTPCLALYTDWDSSLPTVMQLTTPRNLQARVQFWKKVYSELSENEGVFHNVNNPEIIYGELNFSKIKNNTNLSAVQKQKALEQLIEATRKNLALQFKIKNLKIIRFQTGLKERMQKALLLSGQYLPMMEQIFSEKGLPPELTRLVFVESSFNINAQSKVGASGLWQIMPSVAKEEGFIQRFYDKRNHPYYSTKLAAEILKHNHSVLRSWPLAVTAYNHGLYGLKKMIKKNNSKKLDELIEKGQKTKSWGFASENFYACLLATIEVEKEAKSLFGSQILKMKELKMSHYKLTQAISKEKLLIYFSNDVSQLKKFNPHLNYTQLKKNKNILPEGTPVVLPKKIKASYLKAAKL